MAPPGTSTDARSRLLADAIVTLAGTPEQRPDIDARLRLIARLAADRVAAATYASVTALRGEDFTTVAASSELAVAVDEAQYADNAGPCLQALNSGEPVAVPDVGATMQWPGFHEAAPALGLEASVSIPLYAGRGAPIAVLNLYGHDRAAMAPLVAGVWSSHDPGRLPPGGEDLSCLDPGAEELLTGYAEALSVRATIQLAIDCLVARAAISADQAYLVLCARASKTGVSLTTVATAVVAHQV
jgi:hypothetical protein